MTPAFTYLRTSSDDGKNKCGLPVQREACAALAALKSYTIEREFVDDGVTGKLQMHARPQGKLLIAALLANGTKTVICYDAKRIGRDQPVFWGFAGMCRDNSIALVDANGTDLLDTVQGGMHAIISEMDRNTLVARLKAGKEIARTQGKRVEGQYPYGQSPLAIHDGEKAVIARILKMHADGLGTRRIAKMLNKSGVRTRQGKEFAPQTVHNILHGRKEKTANEGSAEEKEG